MASLSARTALREGAGRLAEIADGVPPAAWSLPGLGEWTVRDLTGHSTRAFLTIEEYLRAGAAGPVDVAGPLDYFLKALSGDKVALNAVVAQRGRQAGEALGADPAASVRAIVDRVLPLVDAAPDETIVPTAAGKMRLIDYLPTRVFELTVHSLDLLAALNRPLDVPASALGISLELAVALASARPQAADLLLGLTGRRPLPSGFTVL